MTVTGVTTARDRTAATPSPRPDRWRLVLLAQTVVAAVAALHAIGRKPLWYDEAFTLRAAESDPWSLLRALVGDESNMAAYYVVMNVWPFGSGEVALRLPSALLAVATVPLLAVLVDRLLGRRAAMLAGFLLALSPFAVRYAQEARSYAAGAFLATLLTLLLVLLVERPRRSLLVGYAAVATLAVYTHYLTALVVVAHVVSSALLPDRGRAVRLLLPALLATCALVLPLVLFVAANGDEQIDWISPVSVDAVLATWRTATGDEDARFGAWVCAVLVLVAAAATLRVLRRGRSIEAWHHGLVWAWLLVPPLLLLVAEPVTRLWLTRYLLFSLPALVALVAAGAARLPGRALPVVAAVLVVLGGAPELDRLWSAPSTLGRDWRSAAPVVAEVAAGRPVLFTAPANTSLYAHYAERTGLPPVDDVLAPDDADRWDGRLHPRLAPADVTARRLRDARRGDGLVAVSAAGSRDVLSADVRHECLRAVGLAPGDRRSVGTIWVTELVRVEKDPAAEAAACADWR